MISKAEDRHLSGDDDGLAECVLNATTSRKTKAGRSAVSMPTQWRKTLLMNVALDIPKPFSTDKAFEELIRASCDRFVDGTSRRVHYVRDAELVVKVIKDHSQIACNWIEIVAFLACESDRKKLAKIFSWSKSGKFIVMERLDTSGTPDSGFMAPNWVTDTGPKNGGTSTDGLYKLCDYAFVKSPDEDYESPYV